MMRKMSSVLVSSVVALALFACGSDDEPADGWPNSTTDEPTDPGVDPSTDVEPDNSDSNDATSSVNPDGTVAPDDTNTGVDPVSPTPPVDDHPPTLAACEEPAIGSPTLRLLTRFEFQNTIDDVFPGIAGQWISSMPSNLVTEAGFDNDRGSVLGGQAGEGLLRTAESIGDAVAGALDTLLPCATSAADSACAGEFIDTYGKRLFRRPLEAAERERYMSLFDTALPQTDFATAIKWVATGLVQSPNAMYRSELGTEQGDGSRALTPYEVATQLAYTFTGTTPSEELLAQAEAGQLTDLVATAKTLIQTEDGRQALHRFFEAYTAYTRAPTKQKPNVSGNGASYDQVSADMVKEMKAFIDDVLFNQSGTLHDLLTSTQTNPSQQLATFYGMPAPSSDYSPVERPAGQGVGFLAQGAFLASYSNADASSPTQRGLFAYTKMLCRAEPPLPDDVPEISEAEPGVRTTRQRYEEVHATGTCAGCHSLFDPIGFAFEHFDEAGRYRADENGLEIDPTGYLQSKAGERLDFAGQEDLANALASLPEVHECFAAYLSTYAFGTSESCLGSSQVPAMQSGSVSIVDAFASLAAEPHFTKRAAQ